MEIVNISAARYTAGLGGGNINVKVTLTDGVDWFVPLDNANSDYQVVLAWVNAGNTIASA